MKHQRRFDLGNRVVLSETTKNTGMIADITATIPDIAARIKTLDREIAKEEQRARIFNPFDPAYPMLATTLIVRRNNLKATIAMLGWCITQMDTLSDVPSLDKTAGHESTGRDGI